jgi:hypothetical protein
MPILRVATLQWSIHSPKPAARLGSGSRSS